MIRVWFNHWFRTAYSLIELMKQDNNENIYIIGSHRLADSPICKVCDEWYAESDMNEEEYLDYCIDFCEKHNVDVFVPHRYMDAICKNKARFDEIGVKLFADDYRNIVLLARKSQTYNLFKGCKDVNVPEYRTVRTVHEFDKAYDDLSSKYESLCVKFDFDEGGKSFRKIVPAEKSAFDALKVYPSFSISIERLRAALSEKETFDDLVIMPYMGGNEVSVDCLKTDEGLIAIPRIKCPGHIEYIRQDEQILDMTRIVVDKLGLEYPCDVQFRYLNGEPYLLEVNARMSGGLPMSCFAAGVNIPNIALHKLMGEKTALPEMSFSEITVSNVELPIIIK